MIMNMTKKISVVVPVYFNAPSLPDLLKRLDQLKSDLSKISLDLEVVAVDDGSKDKGGDLIEPDDFITYIRLDEDRGGGKKMALQAGINASDHPFILTTDADCVFGPGWMQTMRNRLRPESRMLIGPVLVLPERGLISWLQQYEALVLLWITRFTVLRRIPMLCSGANLMFSRGAFFTAGGYQSHLHRASGDDVYLLKSFLENGHTGIHWADDPEACVYTAPVKTWHEWYRQRLRWAGKSGHIMERRRLLLSTALLLQLFMPWLLLALYWPLAVLLPFAEYAMMLKIAIRFRRNFYIGDWFFFRWVYPLAVLTLPLLALFIKNKWKGRPVA